MTTLPNFPHKDQRTEQTKDGRPPENGNYDCVPTSLAAAIQYFDGGYVAGDELKDAEYGESLVNQGTSLARYIDDTTDRARTLYHVSAEVFGSQSGYGLVTQIHHWVDAGFPVIATIPSAWGSTVDQLGITNRCQPPVSSHVIVFYATGNGSLTAMNPWGGFDHFGSDQYWADRLLFCQVWRVFKEESVTLQIADVAGFGFKANADGSWEANGHNVHGGILDAFRALPFGQTGMPLTDETPFLPGYAGTFQMFERKVLVYDPQNKLDKPPTNVLGAVYAGHIEQGPAHDWLVAAAVKPLNQQIDSLDAQVKSLTDEIAALKAQPAPGMTDKQKADVAKLQADVTDATAALTDLEAA